MKPNLILKSAAFGVAAALVLCSLTACKPPESAAAKERAATAETESARTSETTPPPSVSGTNTANASGTNASAPSGISAAPPGSPTNAPAIPAQTAATNTPSTSPGALSGPQGSPGTPSTAPPNSSASTAATASGESGSTDIQLSFQGANVDTVVQWLAKTTGKSVVKHPRVQCQLTIVSSKALSPRDAINLVYRALSLEGFTAIESSKSILIVPDGQEPKMSPEFMDGSSDEVPEGRQRLVKIFQLQHITAGEMKERIKGLLSEKATAEADDRANKLIVTDYTENIRLLTDLIPEIDVVAVPDSVVEIYTLKHLEADELAALLTLVLNERSGSPAPGPSRPSSPSPGPSPMPPSPSSSSPGMAGALQVRLWPDKNSNRLIVSAPKWRIPEIEKLIEVLDTEKPADVAVRVLPLRHVSAEDLVKELGPLYQKMTGRSLKDTIEITANNRSNSLIVLSSESNFKMIQNLVDSLDTDDAQEKVLKAFPLRNADAQDVADQLEELYQSQNTSMRPYYYYFSPSRSSGVKVSFVADRRRNTVIVQAPPASMGGIAEMIHALDEPVTDNALAPKIFPMKYVSAVDIEEVLNELFLKRQQQRSYWDYYYDYGNSNNRDQDAGRLYGKVRITSEPYSNSIIVTSNSPENLDAVEEVLKQLDVPSQAGDTTLRVGLKFAEAVTIATSLNILFARGGSPPLRGSPQQNPQPDPRAQQQPNSSYAAGFELEREAKEEAYYSWLGGQQDPARSNDGRSSTRPVSDLVGRVRVVPDRRTNSLLITSNMHFFAQVLKLINELDTATPQVLIEARIVEVSTDFRDRLGVRISPDGTRTFEPEDLDNSFIGSGAATFREVFAGMPGADALRTGVLSSSVNLDLLIQFLRKNTEATVLAEPQINVADNELGKLFVGSQVPFISSSLTTPEGGRNDAFQYKDVGIILDVTPHINNSEEVALKIRVESSTIRNGQTLFGGAILDTRNFRTDLVVKSGQILILGGIIQRENSDTVRKVPVLGSIPGLGWAFKKRDKIARNVELMVFLRPTITRTPAEAQALLKEVESRMPKLPHWNHETEPPQD